MKEKYAVSISKANVHFEQNFKQIVWRQQSPRSQSEGPHPQTSFQTDHPNDRGLFLC